MDRLGKRPLLHENPVPYGLQEFVLGDHPSRARRQVDEDIHDPGLQPHREISLRENALGPMDLPLSHTEPVQLWGEDFLLMLAHIRLANGTRVTLSF